MNHEVITHSTNWSFLLRTELLRYTAHRLTYRRLVVHLDKAVYNSIDSNLNQTPNLLLYFVILIILLTVAVLGKPYANLTPNSILY